MNIKILNERPEEMTYEQYKQHLKIQKKYLKEKSKGELIWLSARYIPTMTGEYYQTVQGTFKGNVKEYSIKLKEQLKNESTTSK